MLNLNQAALLNSFEESDELSADDLRACVGGTGLSGVSVGVSGVSGLVAPVLDIVPVKASVKAPVTDIASGATGIGLPSVGVS